MQKEKACAYVGIESLVYHFSENSSQDSLIKFIEELNNNKTVNGILVQLPLPKHFDTQYILSRISHTKDVDGFTEINTGSMFLGNKSLISCTPLGVLKILQHYNIDIAGKECVVVGRSNIVGKPMSMLLLQNDGTVTMCHSKTKNLKDICKRADILVCAIGKPKFFNKEYIKDGAVVIDVGIHRQENGKLCGDVDFDNVKDIVSAITPVPGGVGAMTVAMLMNNCIEAAKMQYEMG
jgi:methylenetetrahydrofolate dehydrogenase (NADP+)/methenyltetrahydrofolate cyclohydrolase